MFTSLPFFTKGLICAGFGLGGTFLVLVLIYCTVRVLQRAGRDAEA